VNFKKYNPPLSSVSSGQRKDSPPLRWVRLQADWYRDADVLDLPAEERAVWPALMALAGKGTPHGVIRVSVQSLAREFDLCEEHVQHALDHLWRRGRIRYSLPPPEPTP